MIDRFMNDTEWRIKIGAITLFIALSIIGIAWIINYRYITTGTIAATNWELKIGQLQYQTVAESDWYIPDGGRLNHKEWEIHHWEDYVSGWHYETRSGGTYSCGTSKKPKTCTYPDKKIKVDDHSSRPVRRWKYYYYIDRWLDIAPLITSGTDKENVHWPNTDDHTYNDANIIGNIKLGTRWSHYWIVITAEGKTYERDMIDSVWNSYAKGEHIKLTLGYFNNVIAVEKKGYD
jgi:hypothetical protein